MNFKCGVRRARLLGAILAAAALSCAAATSAGVSTRAAAAPIGLAGPALEHRLVLYHTHTLERIDIVFRTGETYVPEALEKLDYFLRDHRTGEVHHYNPHVFDVLEQLTAAVGHPDGEIDIICGYRTPWSNNYLRTHTVGVAEHSLHMQAEAIDIRMPGVETLLLRKAALELRQGGVGYYPHSNFVHVDVGRVRQWCLECSAKQAAVE